MATVCVRGGRGSRRPELEGALWTGDDRGDLGGAGCGRRVHRPGVPATTSAGRLRSVPMSSSAPRAGVRERAGARGGPRGFLPPGSPHARTPRDRRSPMEFAQGAASTSRSRSSSCTTRNKVDAPSGTAARTSAPHRGSPHRSRSTSGCRRDHRRPGRSRVARVDGIPTHAVAWSSWSPTKRSSGEGEMLTIRHDSFDRVLCRGPYRGAAHRATTPASPSGRSTHLRASEALDSGRHAITPNARSTLTRPPRRAPTMMKRRAGAGLTIATAIAPHAGIDDQQPPGAE